mgnify:CR=1 FL=1
MIEGYQLSLFNPESSEYIQQMDSDIRTTIARIGETFGLHPNRYLHLDPRVVVTTELRILDNEHVVAAANENYIWVKPSYVGDRRTYAEEAMHFLRRNTIVRQRGGKANPMIEEFFGGLSGLLFSDVGVLEDRNYSLSELSKIIDEAGLELTREMGEIDTKWIDEFKRDYLTHPRGYRIADFFFESGLLDKYPYIFFLPLYEILDILAKEGARRALE